MYHTIRTSFLYEEPVHPVQTALHQDDTSSALYM